MGWGHHRDGDGGTVGHGIMALWDMGTEDQGHKDRSTAGSRGGNIMGHGDSTGHGDGAPQDMGTGDRATQGGTGTLWGGHGTPTWRWQPSTMISFCWGEVRAKTISVWFLRISSSCSAVMSFRSEPCTTHALASLRAPRR